MERVILSVKELQQLLGVSRRIAYELVGRSDFPSARIGKRIVIPMDSLMEWVKNGGTAQRDNANSL